MPNSPSSENTLEITSSHAPRAIKFGLLCTIRQRTPHWFGTLCYLIFQLQTISLLLKTSQMYLNNDAYPFQPIVTVFIKIMTLTDWSTYENRNMLNVWAPLVIVDLVQNLGLMWYINYKIWKKKPVKEWVQMYWNIICYVHPLVTFFPCHCFCLQVLKGIGDGTFTEEVSKAYTVIFILCLVGNFWLSFASTHIYHLIIKTKDPLASKNNYIKGKDITIKSIVPILWMFADDVAWLQTFVIVVLVIEMISKNVILFKMLPYYHIKVLEMCAGFQGAQTALALTILLTKMLEDTKLGLGNYFVMMCWIVLIPISAKIYNAILWRILKYIVTSVGFDLSPYYLVHKATIIRYFMKHREVHHRESVRVDSIYYFFAGLTAGLEKMNDMYKNLTKEKLIKGLKGFYEGIADNHPDSALAQVCLAYYYMKYEGAYLMANNVIEEVMKGAPSFSTRLSMSLIQYKLQRKLLKQYSQEGNDGLNILKYVQTNMMNDKLKQRMKRQVKLQLEFWTNFLSNQPDMGKLVTISQKVDTEKNKVARAWKEVLKLKSMTFASPLLLYGVYISFVSNNTAEGEKYMEKYHNIAQKLKKIAQSDELNNDTIMFEDTIQISMSGSKTKIGRILDCSTNIEQGLGWKKNFIIGRPIILIMPPYYKSKHDRFLLNHYNTGETKLLNRTQVIPVLGSDGFIRPTWTHIKMNPLVEQGISYVAVMRPLKHPRRMILVRKDGTIDAMSKDFAIDMNINPQQFLNEEINVFSFCPDFRAINTVFNMMASTTMKENYQNAPHTPRTGRRHHTKGTLDVRTRKASQSLHADKMSLADFTKASDRALQQLEEESTATAAGGGSHLGGLGLLQEPGSKPFSLVKEGSFNQRSSPFSLVKEGSFNGRSPNKAKSVFENFTSGSKLVFHPQRDYVVNENKIKIFSIESGHHRDHSAHPVTYNVQIVNRIHGNEFIKIINLEKIVEEDHDHAPSLSYVTHVVEKEKTGVSTTNALFNNNNTLLDAMRFSFKAQNTMKEHGALIKKSSTGTMERITMSPKTPNPNDGAPMFSPHNNLASTKRFFLHKEEDNDMTKEGNINDSMTMDVFDENPSQRVVRDNVLGHEGILSSTRDNIFLSSGRLLKNGTGLMNLEETTPKTAIFYGCDLNDGKKFDLLEKIKTATFQKEELKGVMEKVKDHKPTIPLHNIQAEEGSMMTGKTNKESEEEDNDMLRLKLRRLKEKFNTAIMNKVKVEQSVGSSYLSKEKKVQKLIAKVLNMDLYKKSARYFMYCFLIYILVVLVIQSIQAAIIFMAINGIEGKTAVVKNGVFRLNSLITVSKYARMWYAVLTDNYSLFDDWDKDNEYVRTNLENNLASMVGYNKDLLKQISEISEKYQPAFFQKNVKMYDRDLNNQPILLGIESNFEATAQVTDKVYRATAMEIPPAFSHGTVDSGDLIFINDNGLNDLLISSENAALALSYDLKAGLDKVQDRIVMIYGFLIAMAVLFFFACVKYLHVIRSDSKAFMNLFFRLSDQEVDQARTLLEHFLKVLDTNVHHIEIEDEKPSQKPPQVKSPRENNKKVAFRKASMDGLYRQQIKQFGMLTPIYLFIILINLGYLLLAKNTVKQIISEQNQIEQSLRALYQQNLVVTEFFEILLTNSEATVRNLNVTVDFQANLKETKSAGTTVDIFRDKNGDLTRDQQNAFYSFACEDFNYYSFSNLDLLLQFCPIVGNGEDQVGLVSITLELYSLMTYYYDLYDVSDKTHDSLAKIFIQCISEIQGPVLLSAALWNVLYEATETSFHARTSSIRNQAIAFTVVIILLMLIGALVLWFRVIKRIFLLERIDRGVLQLVPIRIILTNRFLKQYLIKHSNGILDSVRKFM